jgi:large subunit ribosomal protein L4
MKINTYSNTGKKGEVMTLPVGLMADENMALLTQAIRVFENRMHPGISRTKTRSEVKTSTRKIYKQKGTGGARHGAKSAPIFVGGGTAHGPSGNKRVLSLPAKMRSKALQIALGVKANEGSVVVVNDFSKVTKAKEAQNLFDSIVKEEKYTTKRFTVALSDKNKDSYQALRNLKNVSLVLYKNLNAYSVFFSGILVLDSEALNQESGIKNQAKEKKVSVKPVAKVEPKKVEKKIIAKKAVKKEKTQK